MKKGDKIIGKNNEYYSGGRQYITKRKSYELISNIFIDYDGDECINFIDDNDDEHHWCINNLNSVFYTPDEIRKLKLESL